MEKIDARIEQWKNKLLDLGRRNRLLNYKDTARSSLRITYPSCEELFDALVRHEAALSFPRPFLDEDDCETGDVARGGNDRGQSADYGGCGSCIRTNKEPAELQKVLRGLRNKAKTAIEEQGVNVLYLCFGFLKWTEAEHANVTYAAPLLLVPVALTVASITSPYVMTLHEDEIVVNPTLAYKLTTDYGLTLPDFDEARPLDVFFEEVRAVVHAQRWTVTTEVGMSLLSFLKINMYDDLNKHHDAITANPIVRAISGYPSALAKIPSDIIDYDFDKNDNPRDVFQVVDADASQQEAILLAKKGVSFILQGPPGTGKSQTITNIIAESLAGGKKVLFVSEKMAALDVVHRRLTAAGLDDFCLVLHSHKTTKRSVLDQLEKVLDLSQKKVTLNDEAYRRLDHLLYDRQKLNGYAQQLFTKVSPLGKTIYEANGIIANLAAYDDLIFPIPNVGKITKDEYDHILLLLGQFSSTIGKMSGDYRENPWRGATLGAVTNEFRHDASANLSAFLPVLKDAEQTVQGIYETIRAAYPLTIDGVKTAETVLAALHGAYEVPVNWIYGSEKDSVAREIKRCADTQKTCRELAAQISDLYDSLRDNLSPVAEAELFDIDTQAEQIDSIERILRYEAPYYRWINTDAERLSAMLADAKARALQIEQCCSLLAEKYDDSIFAIDYEGITRRFKTEYTSAFKALKKSYREDKKLFLLSSRQIGRKITDAEMLETIDTLRRVFALRQWFRSNEVTLNEFFGNDITSEASDFDAVETQLSVYERLRKTHDLLKQLNAVSVDFAEREPSARRCLAFLYDGMYTDWDEVRSAWDWACAFARTALPANPDRVFVESICSSRRYAEDCLGLLPVLEQKRKQVENGLRWFADCFEEPGQFDRMSLGALHDRVYACVNGLSLLEEWIDFRTDRKNCIAEGLEGFVNAVAENSIPARDILPVFKKRFFRLWLDAVLPQYPAVLHFRRKQQDNTILEFDALDKEQFRIAKARIKGMLINALPSMDHFTSGTDEISVLKRELAKRRRIMPIRKLFREIPNLLLTLKPCLMMSPLSVSLFLEADSYKFDIVIFDEASQIYTENAIGAVFRGKQVVIAGDSKQLPPTSFFQTTVNEGSYDYDDESEEDIPVFESILDEANMLPERTLRWHYRSRHESLIAFSNAKIYKGRMITFPSNVEQGENNGVEYIHVPRGFYDRGGKRGNVPEAERVAELVFDHFRTQPHRTLGVIAFGEVQQVAIETALRGMRLRNQAYEDFFSEDKEEAFFVKSLENVQGDERDTIIFSIGYAPDASGVFRMNFGPLGKSGGERRLNVAITRAKYNVKLVGSILPTDINIDAITTEGPKLLRMYMEYAIHGTDVLAREVTADDTVAFDSPFEEAVYSYLDRKGYALTTQVGCSGYRIDIGVKHPRISGVYVLGVECDGASYHSAKTARERDRLRQDVLENMGWTLYRIWSTDWIKDPVTERQKLVDAIERAIRSFDADGQRLFTQPDEESDEESLVQVEMKRSPDTASYGFAAYRKTECSHIYDLRQSLQEVINNEYPIHYDLLCKRVAEWEGREKVTSRVRENVDYALSRMRDIAQKDNFYFPKGYTGISVRLPNPRKIQHIHTEELACAMLTILRTYVGATRKTLIDETARVYGFGRTTAQIGAAMEEAIAYLLKHKTIEETDGKLRVR